MGAAPNLRALGYEWRTKREGDAPTDEYTGLGYAHLKCLLRARDKQKLASLQQA